MGLSERQKGKDTAKRATAADWKARARANKAHALSQRTRDAYADQWRWFEAWCAEHNERALPAEPLVIGAYLTAQAANGWKVAP